MQARISRARHLAVLILTCLFLAAFPLIASAATLDVPSQYATIGAAVAAASSGDTIVLAPGTYNDTTNDLNLTIDKSLTFEASDTAADTIIDCNGANSFIQQLSSNSINLTFQNLTFQDSSLTVFDFDFSSGSTFTFNNCAFTSISGEAIDANEVDTTTLTDCTASVNAANLLFFVPGGGSITIQNSTLANDLGTVLAGTGSATVTGCAFTNDGVLSGAGPVYWTGGTLTVTDSSFTGGASTNESGAISVETGGVSTTATIARCLFSGDVSLTEGGAIYLDENGGTLLFTATDCVFVDNSADSDGAAIAAVTSLGGTGSIAITNCSFFGNSYTGGSPSGQGAISADTVTPVTIFNSILYGDATPKEISTVNVPQSITVAFSDIDQLDFIGVNSNIDADPQFANSAGGDLHIMNASPCVQTADFAAAPVTDFNQYVWGSTASMGAYSPIHFDFSTPTSATIGSAFPFSVTAMAADDTTAITNYAGTVHFTSSDNAASLPADSALTNGTGTFNPTLNTSGVQTITAADTSTSAYTSTSANINVSGPATHFVVSAPATVPSYVDNIVTVTALDASNNVAAGYTGTVHLTSTDPGFVNATGDGTLTNGVGVFVFALKTAGTQTITATDTVDSSITGTSNDITVEPGPTTRFTITAPSNATAGSSFSFTVTAQDLFGNTTPAYAGTVHFTSTDGAATLPADATLTNGVGTFNATLSTLGNQTITVTDTSDPSIQGTSNNVLVDGPATHFTISAPASAAMGTAFNFTVTALDQIGDVARGYSGTVHFTTTDGTATLPADSMLTNGVGAFSATLNALGNQTITGTDTVTSSITGTSNAITVSPNQPVLTTFPAGLQMIAAPADYTGLTPSQIFAPGGETLAVWQAALANYVVTPTSPADTIRPGVGYWVHFTASTALLDTGQPTNPSLPFSIPLTKGWNMIGDPFAGGVPLSQIKVAVNGSQQSFPGHGKWGRTVVMDHLYTYPAGASAYQTETSALNPYVGYWLYADQSCTLIVPAPGGP